MFDYVRKKQGRTRGVCCMILKIKKKKRERLEASRQAKNRAWCQGQRNFIALLDKGL